MLTKTIKVDQDVLEALEKMGWSEGGSIAKITEKLERPLYLKCSKVFEVLGGKWDRKIGGIVFEKDPRERIEGIYSTGSIVVEKDGFFETPIPVILRMFELVPFCRGTYLEPSAGLGAIACKLPLENLYLVEKNESRCNELRKRFSNVYNADFLTIDHFESWCDRIYMNPPFENSQDIDHVMHAYSFLAPGGGLVSVMSEGAFVNGHSKNKDFRSWLASINSAVYYLPEGSFKSSGTMVNTRLLVVWKL